VATRGTSKFRSVEQEDFIAKKVAGRRSPSSGASDKEDGDVRNDVFLIECKTTGEFDKPAKSISLRLSDLEKIRDEAYASDRIPVMALRIHNPNSPLADANGNIDIIANFLNDWLYIDRLY
jgi:hypothetical protein